MPPQLARANGLARYCFRDSSQYNNTKNPDCERPIVYIDGVVDRGVRSKSMDVDSEALTARILRSASFRRQMKLFVDGR